MTRYSHGSSIFVPPNLAISAEIPCGAPSWLTRSMKAGGKLYSRPHNSPIFIVLLLAAPYAVTGLPDDVLHDRLQITGLAIDRELPIGAGPFREDGMDVVDRLAAAELVDDVVEELAQLDRELPHRHFGAFAEVDQLAVDPPPRRPPLVLLDERPAVQPESLVPGVELVQLDHDGLAQGGDHHRRFRLGGDVADPEFERAERRMRADVPPDLLGVVDASEVDEQLHVLFVLAPGFEVIGHAGARKAPEYGGAVRLQSGVATHPERRARRQREQVRQKVPRHVEQVDHRLAIGDRNVHVQTENQQGAGEVLQLLDDAVVADARGEHLILPVRERM